MKVGRDFMGKVAFVEYLRGFLYASVPTFYYCRLSAEGTVYRRRAKAGASDGSCSSVTVSGGAHILAVSLNDRAAVFMGTWIS